MKRLLSVLLAVVMTFGLASVAFAANDRITGVLKPIDTNYSPDLYGMSPGDIISYPLTADMFQWSSGTTGGASDPVTRTQISRAGIKPIVSGKDSSVIKDISIVYKKSSVTSNKETAVVQVEFVSPLISTSSKDFECNLFLQRTYREPNSRIDLTGTIENKMETVRSSDSYVNLSGGKILDAVGSVHNLDIDLGNGVSMLTNVFSGRKYYGYSTTDITPSDDRVLSKYSSISDVVKLSTIGLKKSGNYVDFSQYKGYYIYDSGGSYLGNGTKLLPYSDIYYLSTKDLGSSITTGGTGTTKPDTSTDSGSGSGTTTTKPSKPSTSTGSTSTSGTLTKADVLDSTKKGAQKAKREGKNTVVISVKNKSAVTAEALQAMSAAAKEYGVGAQLNANTIEGNAVVGRVSINTANASKLTGEIKIGAHLDNANARKVKTAFNKTFKNKLAVVSLDQNDTFGMPVSIAAKVNLSELNKDNLYFYSYNRATNKYYRITEPKAWVDSNGYLRFTTTMAGDIIISDGALAK